MITPTAASPTRTSDTTVAASTSRTRVLARAWGPTLLAIAACIALLFVWQAAFFREHHPVIDHVAYREQSEQLLDGHLAMPLDADAPQWAVRFTAVTDNGRVFKYLPGTAVLGAASIGLTGDVGLGLAVSLALLMVATSGVAARLGWRPLRRGVAAFLVGASPVVLSNGTVLLSYIPALALMTTALWLVLLATGTGEETLDLTTGDATGVDDQHTDGHVDRRALLLLAGAGLLLGLALLVRQIEIVAWTAVLAGWCLLRPGVAGRTRVLRTAALLLATLPGVALVLVVNRHVTGSVFEFPFTLVSPDDGVGWGLRRVLPTDALERFGPVDGLRTTPRATFDLVMWTLAGPALAVGAAITLWTRRRSPVRWLLAVLAAVIPLAFVFHWANAHAVRAGFYMSVGPFYYLACVPPLVLLGVEGLARIPRRPLVAGLAVVLALQALFLVDHLREPWDYGRTRPAPANASGPPPAPPGSGPTLIGR